MKTSSTFVALVMGLSVVATACADAEDTDELAGESDLDGDESKADLDAVESTYTYYDIRSDLRRCASPFCGGFFVDRVNRSETKCAGGAWEDECYVADLDWSESGLAQSQIDTARGAMASGNRGRILVRGYIRSVDWGGDLGKHGRLFVTEAWPAQTEGEADGVFVKVKDAGVRCIAAPCESNHELKLNSSLRAMIAGIDFEPSGADDDVITRAADAMFTGGMIIAGYRYTIYQEGRRGKGRRAYQVYLRELPGAAAPCFVGGCSGQLCSDQEGAISTCEWRPEYACYQSATCERQSDATCGWTQTDELQACLVGAQ